VELEGLFPGELVAIVEFTRVRFLYVLCSGVFCEGFLFLDGLPIQLVYINIKLFCFVQEAYVVAPVPLNSYLV
jgi:hypothetical protein